jgi:hypothetical protein
MTRQRDKQKTRRQAPRPQRDDIPSRRESAINHPLVPRPPTGPFIDSHSCPISCAIRASPHARKGFRLAGVASVQVLQREKGARRRWPFETRSRPDNLIYSALPAWTRPSARCLFRPSANPQAAVVLGAALLNPPLIQLARGLLLAPTDAYGNAPH